jgi:hypothetical protein
VLRCFAGERLQCRERPSDGLQRRNPARRWEASWNVAEALAASTTWVIDSVPGQVVLTRAARAIRLAPAPSKGQA